MIPIRIAHISDIHQGVGYPGPSSLSRYNDIDNILKWTAERVITEKCELVLLCGDCFRNAKVMLDKASQEITSIVRFLRQLTEAGIEVIAISGTPSHDSTASYEIMKEMKLDIEGNCRIFTQPQILNLSRLDISIACLPGLNRSMLMTNDEYKSLPVEQIHRIITDKISMLCQGMAAQMPGDKPKILMAHMTYQNADTGFQDLLMQHEPILTREAVSGFDLVCLGHIHRPQQIDGKVFYSGPIERLSFNEQDIKPGFWIHDLQSEGAFFSEFIETPARPYITIEWNETQVKNYIEYGLKPAKIQWLNVAQDAIVRLRYSCSEEVAKQLNRKQLEQALYDAGAFYVSEIKGEVQRTDRARDNTVNESLGPVDALKKWAVNQGIEESEIKELQSMAESLLGEG